MLSKTEDIKSTKVTLETRLNIMNTIMEEELIINNNNSYIHTRTYFCLHLSLKLYINTAMTRYSAKLNLLMQTSVA